MGTATLAETDSDGRRPWSQTLRKLFGISLDLALPPLCPACREPVGAQAALCAACWSKLSFIAPPYCERLGTPFAYDPGPGVLSMQAIADPPAYRRARAAVRYDDVSRILIHGLKYSDRLDLAPMLGRWMARAGCALLEDADALVPVPLHWRRLWARRFNQSAALAKIVSQASGVPVAGDALKRVKPTLQQVGLSASERALRPFARRRAAADPDRRRADFRGDHRRLRPRAQPGRRRGRRRAGVRAGCGHRPQPHIVRAERCK
jgi:predicted amidophosphoribosyltransferase